MLRARIVLSAADGVAHTEIARRFSISRQTVINGRARYESAEEPGTDTVRDPEMVTLGEVIEKINKLFPGDHPDSSVRNVVTHLCDRLEESETLRAAGAEQLPGPVLGEPGPAQRVPLGGDRDDGLLGRPVGTDSQQPRPVAETAR